MNEELRNILRKIRKTKFAKIEFLISEDTVDLLFELTGSGFLIKIQVETYCRIMTSKRILLCTSDLYLNKKHKENSISTISKQHVKKSLLYDEKEEVNKVLKNKKVKNVYFDDVGDLKITFINDVVISSINEFLIYGAKGVLYRITYEYNNFKTTYVVKNSKEGILFAKINY